MSELLINVNLINFILHFMYIETSKTKTKTVE